MSATLVVSPEALSGLEVRITGNEYRHLFRARRLAVGERVRLVDGEGRARLSTVLEVSRTEAVLALGEKTGSHEPGRRVEIVTATLRPQRASWLVEKATELGVSAIRFVATERAPRRLGERSLERLRRVACSAVEQSGRSRLPELSGVHEWTEVPDLIGGLDSRWLLEPGQPPGIRRARIDAGSVAVLVGPEGGFAGEEKRLLRERGCLPTGLGPRILRVETAALAAAALLLVGAEPAPERSGRAV